MRQLVRKFLPPILIDVYRVLRGRGHVGPIWTGVYASFGDVPLSGEGFDTASWLDGATRVARELRERASRPRGIPDEIRGRHTILPLVIASAFSPGEPVSVLDVGGGIGVHFLGLKAAVPTVGPIRFDVVESRRVCDAGRAMFAGEPALQFHDRLPAPTSRYDVAHLNNVLQFVDDYRGLLRETARLAPTFLILGNLSAGDIPTYASAQRNVPGSVLGAWFFNVQEIVEFVQGIGYTLVFRAASDEVWPQDNFAAEYRLGRPSHLVFRRV